ncbi:F-box/LRR-repeat protein At3g48880-like [Coffea arabica]|uniref:F-box/LRR-repeat protein At3g48880-like n=1 Tax=Coffea arabica TaxID=13443 RepID=A0A6P6TRF9_COFAR|nr:F-box/LRR-repeat protein At3g48880-like [Coffea arabica]
MDSKRLSKSKATGWSDMPHDILLRIFAFVSIMDRMLNVSRVCSSWRRACSDAVFSSTLDISEYRKSQDYQQQGWRSQLELIFQRGIHLGGPKLTKLVFDIDFEVEDTHLTYAAERCPNLQELLLHIPVRTTEQGLATAFRRWTMLERLYISFFGRPHVNIFSIVGERCPLLTELKICGCFFNNRIAVLIGRHMPGLKKLSFRCAFVTRDGVQSLLNMMQDLDELYICVRKIEVPFYRHTGPGPAIMCEPRFLQNTSRLSVYHICYTGECGTCPASTMATPLPINF